MSSEYENVVGGKLRLKGNPLEVKTGGISKKKKKKLKLDYHDRNPIGELQLCNPNWGPVFGVCSSSRLTSMNQNGTVEYTNETDKDNEKDEPNKYNDHLTPAKRRYLQQLEKIDSKG